MNKYRVDGKQLLLKLAQPKYRAPRQPRHMQQQQQQYQSPGYESSAYYTYNQVYIDYVPTFFCKKL